MYRPTSSLTPPIPLMDIGRDRSFVGIYLQFHYATYPHLSRYLIKILLFSERANECHQRF